LRAASAEYGRNQLSQHRTVRLRRVTPSRDSHVTYMSLVRLVHRFGDHFTSIAQGHIKAYDYIFITRITIKTVQNIGNNGLNLKSSLIKACLLCSAVFNPQHYISAKVPFRSTSSHWRDGVYSAFCFSVNIFVDNNIVLS